MASRVLPQQMTQDYCQEIDNIKNLIYVESILQFAHYDEKKGYFKLLDKKEFNRRIYRFLVNNYQQPVTTNLTKDICNQISWYVENRIGDLISSNYIALKDQLLNLDTMGYEPFSNQRPTFFNIDVASGDIDIKKAEHWIKFVNEVIVGLDGQPDPQLIDLVQEMFGYYLMNTLEGHASFFLVGEGNNGKSVMLSVLREMIGREFTNSVSIEYLTTNDYAGYGLIGKKANICMEEESSFVKSDRFKTFVSGDDVTVECKYGDSFQWTPTVKFVFATNELPTFSGFNEGLLRRIKIIPFNKKIEEHIRDTKLTQKLLKNMGGVVAWALIGINRLRDNKFIFTKAQQSKDKLIEFSGNLSSGVLFFRENYVEDEKGLMYFDDLYESYKVWAEKRGKKRQSYYSFIKDINKICDLPVGKAKREGENRVCEYRRLSLISDTVNSIPDFD